MQEKIKELISRGIIESAHDVSEGGLFVALLESAFGRELGFDVVATDYETRKDAQWFGEKQSRVVVTVSPSNMASFKKAMSIHPYEELGVVTNGPVEVDGMDWGEISYWKEKYDTAIENFLSKEEAGSALSAI
jgi:phosphoribosylformylglycinamidine synthase